MPTWITKRIGVCLSGLLIFSVLLTITGLIASYDARRKIDAFAGNGYSVNGTVTNKSIRDAAQSVARPETYTLDVSFQTEDGRFHYGSTEVTNTIYELSRVGAPIRVTYVRSNPDWFYVANDPPTYPDVAVFLDLFRYGAIGSLVILILLGAFVFWTPSGAASAGVATTDSQSGLSFPPSLRQRRGGFGKRPGF